MNSFFMRAMRYIAMVLGLAFLAGCFAQEAKVDPTRTVMMVTFATAPKGVDGMVTTKTIECNFRRQISVEKAKEYEANPGLVVEENACVEFDDKNKLRLAQLAVQGSPQMAGEFAKAGITAASGGLVNFLVQSALQDKQGKICRDGGCINTVNNNVNVNENRNSSNSSSNPTAVADSESGAIAVTDTNTNISLQNGGADGCTVGCK